MKINWHKLIAYSLIVFIGCSFWYAVIIETYYDMKERISDKN